MHILSHFPQPGCSLHQKTGSVSLVGRVAQYCVHFYQRFFCLLKFLPFEETLLYMCFICLQKCLSSDFSSLHDELYFGFFTLLKHVMALKYILKLLLTQLVPLQLERASRGIRVILKISDSPYLFQLRSQFLEFVTSKGIQASQLLCIILKERGYRLTHKSQQVLHNSLSS